MVEQQFTTAVMTFFLALAVSFALTPAVRIFAFKVNAVDVPKDGRRMHTTPIPRIGGLAIFIAFIVAVLAFGIIDKQLKAILLGSLVIVVIGVIDDIVTLPALIKLLGQIVAALIPVLSGVRIESFTNPLSHSGIVSLGAFSIPITVIWIVAIVNAVNFIDGLDGLACGVSCISSVTMFIVAAILGEPSIAFVMAALAGACLGFLPFNFNPAKIFMGDTGAMFLGFILATVSVQGLFKMYALISFAVPFIALAIPIADMLFAVIRRVMHGKSPFSADRGHIHHKLIDMGFNQKQSVLILYCLSAILGVISVMLTKTGEEKSIIVAFAVILSFSIALGVMAYGKSHHLDEPEDPREQKEEKKDN
ncbi:MAG: undecaprenyl/decaprenyl-phosphate alpha-N-acetylglucosaminyl 1-phosphate transferase [Clostridia bacterium]|nr:undecaprenyl/decaprenyl-phosphate alpha-N-acetylglucosaminyl 1-phosphate transferase [Clostridia bacterium]